MTDGRERPDVISNGNNITCTSTSTIGSLCVSEVTENREAGKQNVEFSPRFLKPEQNGAKDSRDNGVLEEPPLQDLSERMLTLYLQHLGNSVYLMLIMALGFVYPLINALSYGTEKYEKSKEQFEIFMIIIHGISIIVLSLVLIRLTLRKSDEDRGHGEGLNFFLRIGAIVFCIGVIILNILRALEPIELQLIFKCHVPVRPTHVFYYSLSVIFYALQTYFMFKYHKTSFLSGPNRHEKHYIVQFWIIRYALMHLIGVNLIHWLYSIMWEAGELFEEANQQFNNVSSTHYSNANKSCGDSISKKISSRQAQPYLFPCVIEYSLIAASALLGMYMRLGAVEEERIYKKLSSPDRSSRSTKLSISETDNGDPVIEMEEITIQTQTMNEVFSREIKNGVTLRVPSRVDGDAISTTTTNPPTRIVATQPVCKHPRICEKAHVGFFSGLMFLAGSIVYIACEFIFKAEIRKLLSVDIAFTAIWGGHFVVGIGLTVYVIVRLTSSFRFDFHLSVEMEKMLLYVTYFVNLIFLTACTVAEVSNASDGLFHNPSIRGLNVFAIIAQIIQESLQAIYVLYGLNLRAITRSQRKLKPGRTALTILIFLNMIIWLRESLLLKSFIITTQYIHYYGLLPWCMIASACFPMIIFFRFHSASLLAEIWSRAYD